MPGNKEKEGLKEELQEHCKAWSRSAHNTNVPSGIPDVMFTVPQLWGTEDFIVPHSDLDICKEACKFLSAVPCDEDIFDLCTMIMSESGLTFPKDISEAQEFYYAPL